MLAYFRIKHPLPDDVKEKLRVERERMPSRTPEQKAEDLKKLIRFDKAHWRIAAEADSLLRQYPDQWIAMDADIGFLAAADTWEELYRKLDDLGYSRREIAIREMNTKPRKLIL